MENEELRQAINLFDTPEKWNAFIELSKHQDRLKQMMTRTAVVRANQYFRQEHQVPGWSFMQFSDDKLGMVWYLTAYGENSICLVLSWGGEFVLEVRNGANNVAETTRLLKDSKFSALLGCFERVDTWWDNHFLARERFNFSFGSPSDGHFGPFRLAWYAHFATESFIEQLGAKVARFQLPEMTALLTELNALTRKSS